MAWATTVSWGSRFTLARLDLVPGAPTTYRYGDEERAMVTGFDVAGMQKHGVNPMLTLGFWTENAPNRHPAAYMKALRGVASEGQVFSAGLKQ